MIKHGDTVTIKTSEGERYRAVATAMDMESTPVGMPGNQVPGYTTYTLTLNVDPRPMESRKTRKARAGELRTQAADLLREAVKLEMTL